MKIENITVIGAGTMGHGIAQLFALAGFPVTLTDVSLEILEKTIPRIQNNLQTCIKHGIISDDEAENVPDRITLTTNLDQATSQADYIIEAVVEDLEAKLILLRELDENCPVQTRAYTFLNILFQFGICINL